MGFLVLDEERLANQQDVVRNERRQRIDNQPYGTVWLTLQANVFPSDHPYHHPVIGSHEDLEAATMEDVQAFYDGWYRPNNAVLVVCGDFDPEAVENAAFGVFHGGKVRTFKLRFTPELAPYIRERTWHPSQRLVDLDDSGVELTFRCSESHEISSWVASWLGGAEVLEPESLREEMAALGRKLTKTHNTGG